MAKLTLKYGEILLEYEGPEDFLKAELKQILKAIEEIGQFAPVTNQKSAVDSSSPPLGELASASVSTLAQKLSVNTGPDLIAAAALSLALGGSPAFKKKQLRDRSREAKTFWKKSYSNNFDNYVNRLVSNGRLNHIGGDDYAIPESEQKSLRKRLSGQ